MKAFKKLIPALAMLLVSAVLLGTSTFAWFSMNNRVTVTGMSVKTEVKNNLLIAAAANDTTPATLNGPIASMPGNAAYGTHLVQSLPNVLLEPVSSTTGLIDSFFYTSTNNVVSSGDAKTDTYVAYDASNTTAFNTNYGTTGAVGYVDYVFALQATNTNAGAAAYVNMTKCDLTYQGSDTTGKAFRVAVLVQECDSASVAQTSVTTKTILGITDAAYFTSTNAVSGAAIAPTAVTTFGTAANIAAVPAATTKYYKVTIRLWLEGEDDTCNNATYANLTNSYSLDLAFDLENATGGVTEITKASKAANAWTVTTAAATGATTTLSGTTYYAYTASGTPTTIYGDVNTGATNVTHWYNIDGTDVFEITPFVTVSVSP